MCGFYLKEGYVCFSDAYTNLLYDLDEKFKSFFSEWEYQSFTIPVMLDEEVLVKCGYFESFPDQITLACSIDQDSIPDIINGKNLDTSCIKIHKKYLTPSACLHIYPMFDRKNITKNTVITTYGRVFRSENSDYDNMTRLWDFSVRELVFIGSQNFVKESLEKMKQRALLFAKKIANEARIEVAHDHFYKNYRNDIKTRIQLRNEQKFELLIPISGKDVSVASFNYHGCHFSVPFQFDQNQKIVSGCVGFGMERWVAACIERELSSIHDIVN